MKLLSDFDGVWTDPLAEARAQAELVDRDLVAWAPEALRGHVVTWLANARARVRAEPTRWGWLSNGALSAYADEDPFVLENALLLFIARAADGDAIARSLRDGVLARHASLDAYGGSAHGRAVEQVAASRGPEILADASDAAREWLAAGGEIVVVSNSTADKLARWFSHAQLPFTLHPEQRAGAIRLRGDAKKFVLDPGSAAPLMLERTEFAVGRPAYEALLRAEAPAAVVGDVFSLDLAMPLALRRRERAFRELRLFWLMRDYAPAWLRELISRAAPEIERVEGGLATVVRAQLGRS
jgi:hypothetical protein